ncbi:hypothetical protein GUITHDRAFT_157843 [Guillardia theta CCMP2712]|uniref:Flavoprotein domain-containing protein n=1 Tax=Guillardia theta (strain CCMP2712) TaxID=905079 RepID=L1JCB1_GUITC|nr:hypothetical protein GUITHDRAFT_157843 [Guillardia theta CCMP2712]EKX45725.1 hypothetical protein GUITHDRAFT_157843 [Guillardia theta CCMP2712]|eukprot:XP_005832705.1 hypothetical protein GUITHDRAFT_157843 [Guillardia theta CCMP2712]
MRILLGLSGSVAAIKAKELVEGLGGAERVRVVVTGRATSFFDVDEVCTATGVKVYTDEDEWGAWKQRGDPVRHIELSQWADVLVIAPLSANTLAKLSWGMADNLLTSIARAWDFRKPMIAAPAMNTAMWHHPITSGQIQSMMRWGRNPHAVRQVLVCGQDGVGAMASVESIAASTRM